MNNQAGTSKLNTDAPFTHSSAKIARLKEDVKIESDDEDYLITIKEEGPCEESIIIESTPISTFTVHEDNVKVEQYLENSGTMITFNVTKTKAWLMQESKNPIEYFISFLDERFLDRIVKSMNQEARLCHMFDFRGKHDLIDVTVSELKIFIGLWLHTGTAKMNSLPEYWNTHRLFKSCFPDYMELERFRAILKRLEFPTLEPNHCTAIDNFNRVMDRYYLPGRNLQLNVSSIDMFHNSITITTDTDVNKTGALSSNIFVLFEQGGPILKIATDDKACSTSISHKKTLFLTLLEGKLDNGHSLYVTPEITIPASIAILLLKRKTYCNGILQPELSEHGPNEDDSVYLEYVYTGPYCVDTNGKTTYYISTEFKGSSESEPGQVPEAIRNYMEKPKLDEFQDICSYYPSGITDLSEGSKVFIFILMASIKNASIAAGIDFNDYRLKIMEHLLPENEQSQINKEKNKHRLTRIPSAMVFSHSDSLQARRDCYNCAIAKNLSRVTVYWCSGCENSPALCVECFFDVHVED